MMTREPAGSESSCSVVVPVYNSEKTLKELVSCLARILPAVSSRYELIFVNDGSRDGSWDVISELTRTTAWVQGIDLMRNYGQHNALLCGIQAARHNLILTLDDDLQHPPEEIPKLFRKLAEGYDVVYGIPRQEQHGFWRDLASRLTKIGLQSAMGASTARQVTAFRLFRTPVREAFQDYRSPFLCIDVLLTWGTQRFSSVTVQYGPRQQGKSMYTFSKLVTHALNMITGFSLWPLQMASVMGFAFTLFGFFVLVYVVGRYFLEGGSIPGFPFLASIIALFSGAQLFALGIIGEYLSRMHFRMMGRPTFAVRRSIQGQGKPA